MPRAFGAAIACIAGALGLSSPAGAAEHIKVGGLLTTGYGAVFLAIEHGYFADEGLDVETVKFDAGQPVAVAAVSGDIDVGMAGVTSALYTLAQQGALKIIAGFTSEHPGFHASNVVVSNQAYAAGVKTVEALAGHSFGLTQIGSSYHYLISVLAEKHGLDIKTMRLVPLQSLANVASALVGGQIDGGILIAPQSLPLVERGSIKSLLWTSDEISWQVALAWTSTKNANERGDVVKRYLRAFAKGTRDYDAAFISADGKREDGPTAPAAYAILGKYLHETVDQMKIQIGYIDPEDRVDEKDVARQIAWYQSQGMIKGDVDINRVIDRRYAVALPER